MQLKDLPEEIQKQALALSNTIVRDLQGQPVELLDILDKAVVAGMALEANRPDSKAANLYQTLIGLKMAVFAKLGDAIDADLLQVLNLADEVLFENKPEII